MLRTKSPDPYSCRTHRLIMSRQLRRSAAVALLLVMTAGQGCYTYHMASLPELRPEEEVRVTLNEEGFRSALPGANRDSPRRLEGRFGGATADSLILRVWIGEAYEGTPFYSTYQNMMLPMDQVLGLENRQLSRGRTAVVTAGVLVLIGVLIESIGVVDFFGGGGDGGPPDPPEPEPFIGGVIR